MTTPVRQSSFAAGELDPALHGKTDAPEYARGLATCKNAVPLPRGQWENRAGTKSVAAVKDSTTKPRLVPFIFSDGQSFVIEFGDLYVRFFSQGAVIGAPYEVVSPWAIADVDRLKFSQVGDVIVVTHASYAPRDLTRIANTNWTITSTVFSPKAWWGDDNGFGVPGKPNVYIAVGYTSAAVSISDDWSAIVTYSKGDYALEAGILYVSNVDTNLNLQPSTHAGVQWLSMEYVAGNTYQQGAYVWVTVAGTSGILYISLINKNTGNAPAATPTAWAPALDTSRQAREWQWVVTQVWKDANGIIAETLPSSPSAVYKFHIGKDRPATLFIGADGTTAFTSTVLSYNWYRGRRGLFGYVGSTKPTWATGAGTFFDEGQEPDFSQQPPAGTDPFSVTDASGAVTAHKYPSVVVHHDQRRVYARTDTRPHRFVGSELADFGIFDVPFPVKESDSFDYSLAATRFEEIRSAVSLERLLLFTSGGEWSASGSQGDALSALSVNVRRHSQHGSSWLDALVAGTHVLFVTAKGNRVRAMVFDYNSNTYVSTEVSVHGRHLIDNHTIVDWAYQRDPNRIVWAVREDGALLSLTFDSDANVLAWARHDTGGGTDLFERVCCVPETTEDAVYFLVNRNVNGARVRYVERMSSRVMPLNAAGTAKDVRTAIFLDCAVSIDGRNAGATTMRVTGATYNGGDDVTVLASVASFAAADVGDDLVLDVNGAKTRVEVTAFTDVTHISGRLKTNLAAGFQNVVTTNWGWARRGITGLALYGRTLYALGDGDPQGPFTVFAPPSPKAGTLSANFDPPIMVGCVGLAYDSDGELLDIASTAVRGNVTAVAKVLLELSDSRGFKAGPDFDHLTVWRQRGVSDSYDPISLFTGTAEAHITSKWEKGGRVCWRQSDPLPLTVSAITREVEVGGKD